MESIESPAAVLYDAAGNPIATAPGTPAVSAENVQMAAASDSGGAAVFAGTAQNARFVQLVKDQAVTEAVSALRRLLADWLPLLLPSSQPRVQRPVPANSSLPRSVPSSASSVLLLDTNLQRLGATIYNDSTQQLYLLLDTGSAASTTQFTVLMISGAYYEVPYGYTGQAYGIWASANGNARITEFY